MSAIDCLDEELNVQRSDQGRWPWQSQPEPIDPELAEQIDQGVFG